MLNFPRHLVNKSKVKKFKNKAEKLEFRKSLFYAYEKHPHYSKWFASPSKKGYLLKIHYDFVEDFLERTLDCDQNQFAIEVRNALLSKEMQERCGRKHSLYVDEILSCVQSRIRYEEEGIVEIIRNIYDDEHFENLIASSQS
jgi:hypothetical protein